MAFWRRKKVQQQAAGVVANCNVADNERVYAIGDIHGRLDLLNALMVKIFADAEARPSSRRVRLVFLGDYIDRGDQSSSVIARLIELKTELGASATFLAGNHEAALLAFLDDPAKGRDWLKWGGRQTLASYHIAPPSETSGNVDLDGLRRDLLNAMQDHPDFVRNLDRFAVSGSVVFAHAALDPTLPLQSQPDAALLWGHIADKTSSGLAGYKLVHGHFAAAEPVALPHRICVDTGAYYSGILTAVRLDEEEAFIKVGVDDI